jgi:hypothetical protein
MVSGEVYIAIFVAVVLGVVVVGILLLAIGRLRRRRAQLLNDLKGLPELQNDRAFNRLAMARREVAILAQQGTDVGRARELIAESQAAFDLRKFDRSYELAQSAHESLVAARHGAPLPAASTARDTGTPRPLMPLASRGSEVTPNPASTSGAPVEGPRARIATNQVAAQFELKLLDADLAEAQRDRPKFPGTIAAVELRASAQTAWDAGNYTEALRCALRGRRGLGSVETVAAPPGSVVGAGRAGTGDDDASDAAERAASSARCPECGYPVGPDDAFCRGCGVPRTMGPCPGCGAPRTARDAFCGRCGRSFS